MRLVDTFTLRATTRAHTHAREPCKRSACTAPLRVACPRCMSALCKLCKSALKLVLCKTTQSKSACERLAFRGWLSPPRKSACERLAYAGGSLPAPPRCLLPARALPPQCLQPARQTKRCFIATPQSAACSDGLSSLTTTPPYHPTISRPAALHDRALHAAMHERLNLLMRSASGSPPSPHPSQCLQPARQTKKRCFIDASRRAPTRSCKLEPPPPPPLFLAAAIRPLTHALRCDCTRASNTATLQHYTLPIGARYAHSTS